MGSSNEQVIGYRYYFGVHMITSLPVEELREIWVEDTKVWGVGMPNYTYGFKGMVVQDGLITAVTDNRTIFIYASNCFGGDKQEGGIQGYVDVEFGRSLQPRNAYLTGYSSEGGSGFAYYFDTDGTNPAGIADETFFPTGNKVNGANSYQSNSNYTIWFDGTIWRVTYYTNVGSTTESLTYIKSTTSNMMSPYVPGGATTNITTATIVYALAGASYNDFEGLNADPELIPAYRGVMGFVLNQCYIGTTSYPKPWSFVLRRTEKDVHGADIWYQAKADINGSMNPAHIIREILTSKDFGLGISTTRIDNDSFTTAADALYTEEFGLSFKFDAPDKASQFIDEILNYIDGFLRVNNDTGKFEIKLLRDDYIAGDLDVLDESVISKMVEFSRTTMSGAVNQISLDFTDESVWDTGTVTVQDIAKISIQGSIVSHVLTMPGIHDPTLAGEVATRELRKLSTPLFGCVIEGSAELRKYNLGDPVKISWAPLGIVEAIVRVVGIDLGEDDNLSVKLNLAEDIFGSASSLFADPYSGYIAQDKDPLDVVNYKLIELPYWHYAREIVGAEQAAVSTSTDGYVHACAIKPSGPTYRYDLFTKLSSASDYNKVSDDTGFATWGVLEDDIVIGNGYSNVTVKVAYGDGLSEQLNKYVVIDDEYFLVVSYDIDDRTATLARGMLDTVPANHAKGSYAYGFEVGSTFDPTPYATGSTINCKFRTESTTAIMDLDDVTPHNITMANRIIRPYPPAFITFSVSTSQMSVSWRQRNRTVQTDYLVTQSASSITDEDGTTYSINIYQGSTLRDTITGETGTSWSITDDAYLRDYGLFNIGVTGDETLTLILDTQVNGYYSWTDGTWTLSYDGSTRWELDDGVTTYYKNGTDLIGAYTDGATGSVTVARGVQIENITIEIWAIRDGYDSWQKQVRTIYTPYGGLTKTLGVLTVSATGVVGSLPAITGSLTSTLGSCTLSGAGTVQSLLLLGSTPATPLQLGDGPGSPLELG